MLNDDDNDNYDDDDDQHEDSSNSGHVAEDSIPLLHTPEPWVADTTELFGASGKQLIASSSVNPNRNPYDYRRIASCVNAFKDVADPHKYVVKKLLDDLNSTRNALFESDAIQDSHKIMLDNIFNNLGYELAFVMDKSNQVTTGWGNVYANDLEQRSRYDEKSDLLGQTVGKAIATINAFAELKASSSKIHMEMLRKLRVAEDAKAEAERQLAEIRHNLAANKLKKVKLPTLPKLPKVKALPILVATAQPQPKRRPKSV